MSKITFEKKKGRITVINRLTYPETVNERVYNAIASGMFEGFLPVTIRQKRKETRLECAVQGFIPLTEYFNGAVTKQMFLEFVHAIALLIKSCEKNMINANNIDLQGDKIFVTPLERHVKCIFWPVVNNQRDMPPHVFLKQLPYALHFNPHEDQSYCDEYKRFFEGIAPFSVNNFDRMVLKLMGKQPASGHLTPTGALSAQSGNVKEKKPVEPQRSVQEYDPFAVLEKEKSDTPSPKIEPPAPKPEPSAQNTCFCIFCGSPNVSTAKFCGSCGKQLLTEAAEKEETPQKEMPPKKVPTINLEAKEYGTVVLGEDSPGTTVLGYDDEEELPRFPDLIRERTQESFSIDKPVYRIGTEQKYCDLFIQDNTYISRSHADIITRDDRYYVIDRNSTNRTFVDGKVIPTQKEVEIFAGTRLRLANEDFIFTMEA